MMSRSRLLRTAPTLAMVAATFAAVFSAAAKPAEARVLTTTAGPDKTAPTATIRWPLDGATFQEGWTIGVDYRCADQAGGSGIASCSGSAVGVADATPGEHTITLRAVDRAGNETMTTTSTRSSPGAPTSASNRSCFATRRI
jgi:hypothetical protein